MSLELYNSVNMVAFLTVWPGFDSQTQHHVRVEFVVGSRPFTQGFSPGSPVFPLHKNQHYKFQFNLEQWMKNHYANEPLLLNIYSLCHFIPDLLTVV